MLAVVPALLLSGCMLMHGGHGRPSKAICPVSGETVKIKADTPSMTWKGRQLYFASAEHELVARAGITGEISASPSPRLFMVG